MCLCEVCKLSLCVCVSPATCTEWQIRECEWLFVPLCGITMYPAVVPRHLARVSPASSQCRRRSDGKMNLLAVDHFQLWKSFLTQALLSLGASTNYKDRCGLTPLYHTVLAGGDTTCCETLLYYRAKIGTRDENGWDESHQVPTNSSALAHRVAEPGLKSFPHPAPSSCSSLSFTRQLEQCVDPLQLHPTPSPLSRHSPHLSACLTSLPSSRPFSPCSSLSP